MSAAQGQQYRIIGPKAAARKADPDYQAPRRIGQGAPRDRYRSTFTSSDGQILVVEDIYGDVVWASENVDYPRGPQASHRNVRWIDEHPKRFELIDNNERD